MPSRCPIPEPLLIKLRAHLETLPLRDQVLIEMELCTGFRMHEVLSVTVGQVVSGPAVTDIRSDLTIQRRCLKFGRSSQARKQKSRRAPIPPRLSLLLSNYLCERFQFAQLNEAIAAAPLIYSRKGAKPIQRSHASLIVQNACIDAGLPSDLPWGSHSLRKTFARTIYEGSGHDIELTRAALGHSSVATTQRYIAITEQEAFSAIAAIQNGVFGSAK